MAKNRVYVAGKYLPLTCSHPTTPLSGQPVRIGDLTGVATTDERSDGTTSIDLGPSVYDLKVKGVDDNGNSAVAVGDPLFYVDADINDGTGFLSKKSSGYFFGYALEVVGSGSTDAAAKVLICQGVAAGVADIPAGSVVQADIAPASLDGTVAKVVAADNVIGGIPVVHQIDIAAGALAAKNVVLTHKERVIDAWVVLRGAGVATTTLTVGNGATAITDAMDVSGADKALIRAAAIDDAAHEIAAGGSLRVTTATGATQPACTVYVLAMRVT